METIIMGYIGTAIIIRIPSFIPSLPKVSFRAQLLPVISIYTP